MMMMMMMMMMEREWGFTLALMTTWNLQLG